MEDDDIERSVVPPGSGIRYGEATLGTAEERAAAIAKGNIQTQVQNETLDLPEVIYSMPPEMPVNSEMSH